MECIADPAQQNFQHISVGGEQISRVTPRYLGVVLFGPTSPWPIEVLTYVREELPVIEVISRVHVVLGLRRRNLGRFVRTNTFEIM